MHMTLACSLVWMYAIAPEITQSIQNISCNITNQEIKKMFGFGTATGAIVSLLITVILVSVL